MRQYYGLLKYRFSIRIAYSELCSQCVDLITQFVSAPCKAVFTFFYYSLFVIVFTFAYPPGFLTQYYNQGWGETHFGVLNRSLLKHLYLGTK